MSNRETRFEGVKKIHDELKLQAHLMKKDAQDKWQKYEDKWDQLVDDIKKSKSAAKESKEDIGAATDLLLDELEKGYHHIRQSIKH